MSDTSVTPAEESEKDVVPAGQYDGTMTGLEDFGTEDMVMPRLGIEHTEGKLVDNLTGEKFDKLQVVMLGLIKQRILWDTEVNEGDHPLCKSFNHTEGLPSDKFPWDASGFDKDKAGDALPCASCNLKEWGSHPQRETPWCSEQHTFPVLMNIGSDDEPNFAAPAIFTVQRSGIKPSKTYLTSFSRSKTPLFTVVTEISLNMQKRGSVTYSVPRFAKVADTEQAEWDEFAQHYLQIRDFVTTPPAKEDENGAPVQTDNSHGDDDDDDVPF